MEAMAVVMAENNRVTGLYHDKLGGYLLQGQWDALRFAFSPYNILAWIGATRQGKTRGAVRSVMAHASRADLSPGDYALIGQTKSTVVRNIIPYFKVYAGLAGLEMKPEFPTASHDYFSLLGQRFYMFGGEQKNIPDRIRGMTAKGFLCDEVVLLPREIVEEAFSRMSETGAKAWLCSNKGGRRHWLKRDYIDIAEQLIEFGINIWTIDTEFGENVFMDEQQTLFIQATQSGVRKKRLIDNDWADVEGLIYGDNIPVWSDSSEIDPKWLSGKPEVILSVDPGASNMFASALLLLYRGQDGVKRLLGLNEYVHEPGVDGDLTDHEHVQNLIKWCGAHGYEHKTITCLSDPENKSLVTEFRKAGFNVQPVDKSVDDGINTTRTRMRAGQLTLRSNMVIAIEQMQGYTWDPNAADRGEDKPLKKNDHFCDLLRYAVMYALPPYSSEPLPGETPQSKAQSVAARVQRLRG